MAKAPFTDKSIMEPHSVPKVLHNCKAATTPHRLKASKFEKTSFLPQGKTNESQAKFRSQKQSFDNEDFAYLIVSSTDLAKQVSLFKRLAALQQYDFSI